MLQSEAEKKDIDILIINLTRTSRIQNRSITKARNDETTKRIKKNFVFPKFRVFVIKNPYIKCKKITTRLLSRYLAPLITQACLGTDALYQRAKQNEKVNQEQINRKTLEGYSILSLQYTKLSRRGTRRPL